MEQLLHTVISFVIHSLPTKGLIPPHSFEPGSMEFAFPSFTALNFGKITSEIKEKSKRMTLESLRNGMVSSCSEFNHAYFFMALQCALLVYCPAVALSIMSQSDEQQQDIVKQSQDIQSFIKQQCSYDSQQQPFTQFVQLIQRFISQMMRSQPTLNSQQIRMYFQQYQTQQQQRAIQNSENGAEGVKMAAKPSEEGQGRHPCDKQSVEWHTLIIVF